MRIWRIWAGAVACVLAGCTSVDKEFGEEIAKLTPVEPPTFINGDLAEQFGNATFTARVEVHKGIPGTRPPIVGDFFGRNGSLYFVSDEQRGAKAGISGGLSALWDAPTKTAYLLNDPLQAYAPMKNPPDNGPFEPKMVGEEMMNGERCRKSVLFQTIRNVSLPTLIVWRSIALNDFPIRVESTNSLQTITLNFTRVKFQAPPADLFSLPNGFKAFESTDAMMSELVRRRTDALDARAKSRRAKYGDNDEDSLIQQRPQRPY
jgi:hypothetical protein